VIKSIIRVKDLSKQYRLGARQASYATLRETIGGAVRAPIEAVRRYRRAANETIWALKDVSFEIMPGEVVGIIGRNGAGKSTLLKVLSRITEPTSGRVELYGRIASLLEVGTGFHPELTGRENIYLNGAILGMKRTETERKFDEIVAFAEIEKFLDTPVKHYSSGMYMRLAFAVAAHLEPDILLVDEVLAVGDVAFQQKCLGKMGEVAKHGRTVLFVSHQLSAIAQLCSRALLLGQGGIVKEGDPERVIDYYMNATLFGSNNGFMASAHSDKDLFIGKAQAVDFEGKSKSCFTTAEEIVIAIGCRINRWSSDTSLGFFVRDHRGRKVFTTNYPGWSQIRPDKKQVNVTAIIPRNFLVPGKYAFTIAITARHFVVDSIEDVLPITIVDGGSEFSRYEGGDYGCVFANCAWSIENDFGQKAGQGLER